MKKNRIMSLTICAVMTACTATALAEESEPMLISPAPSAEETIVGTPQITVNGETVDLSASNLSQYIFETDGNVMVPLRAVAEKMGYTVGWDGENRAFTIENDDWAVKAFIGEDLYYGVTKIEGAVGMTAPQSYGTAPVILENKTFVPAKMFELMGYSFHSIGQFVDFSNVADENNVQIPNPFIPYESIDAAKQALSFTPSVPSYIPNGYDIDEISVIGNDFLQIIYRNDGDKTIYYRTAVGNEDISGDYNNYSETKTVVINGNDVTIKGNDRLYHNAYWFEGDNAFSLYSNNGIEKDSMIDIIESVE